MNKIIPTTVILFAWLDAAAPLSAQPALDNLEKHLREQARPTAQAGYLGAKLDNRSDHGEGVQVLEVVPGSPAARAGLKVGDVISKVGAAAVRNLSEAAVALKQVSAGRMELFEILRDGKPLQIEIRFGRLPTAAAGPPAKSGPPAPPAPPPPPEVVPPGGAAISPLAPPSLPALTDREKIAALERRIKELERRVADLERALSVRNDAK
jgi:hypothetical protein